MAANAKRTPAENAQKDMIAVPLSPIIGAEIRNVDLAKPISEAQFNELYDLFIKHQVLIFRDQHISIEQQQEFAQRFGPLHVPEELPHRMMKDHPAVIEFKHDRNARAANNVWHADLTFMETPPLGALLMLREGPEVGGDTLFSNMYAAYDGLSQNLQSLLDGLKATHVRDVNEHWKFSAEFPSVDHPVVRTHPVTKRKSLFVNEGYTLNIKDIEKKVSDALLNFLFGYLQTPEFSCRVRWTKNAAVLWDNRCTMHYALSDFWPATRIVHRVTIAGDRPV
jgi:taurine dioxygenase